MGIRRVAATAVASAFLLTLGAGSASAATVVNGGFEGDNLNGWDEDFAGPGAWFTYSGVYPGKTRGLPGPLTVPPPPRGMFGAMSDQEMASRMIISQVVKLKPNRKHRLSFQLAYANQNTKTPPRGKGFGPGFFTPKSLAFGKAARPNQQFRMDVLKPGAPIKSLRNKDILEQVYRTERGDRNRRVYRRITANLTPYAGKSVRLRFAVVVTEAPLNVGIDAVRIRTKPAG